MPDYFLHGVEVVEIDNGPRPIRTVRSSVIGLIGTAPDLDAAIRPATFADDESWNAAKAAFPLNTPVLIAGSRREAAKLGFTVAVIPKANAPRQPIEGLEIHAVERIEEAMSVVRGLG